MGDAISPLELKKKYQKKNGQYRYWKMFCLQIYIKTFT